MGHTSRLTSSSSALGFEFGLLASLGAVLGAGLARVSRLSILRREDSLVGVPIILSAPGLVTPDLGAGTDVVDGPALLMDDQYPTPGLRDRSINWTDDWTLRISSRRVRFVWRS